MAIATPIVDTATGGIVVPILDGSAFTGTGPNAQTSGSITEWFLVLIGIILTAVAFERSARFGAIFLLIIVLLMVLSAQKKGFI